MNAAFMKSLKKGKELTGLFKNQIHIHTSHCLKQPYQRALLSDF